MKVRALVSFSGAVSMGKGDVRDIQRADLLKDLLECQYVEPVEVPQAGKLEEKPEAGQPGENPQETEGNEEEKEADKPKAGKKGTK